MELEQWRKKLAGDPDVVMVTMHPTAFNNGTFLQKAVQIVKKDGTTVAGCVWPDCTETAPHPTPLVTVHYRTHTGQPASKRGPGKKFNPYADLTFQELSDALKAAEDKARRAEAARDKALDQVANMRDVNRDIVTGLRRQLDEAKAELASVKAAVKVLFPETLK